MRKITKTILIEAIGTVWQKIEYEQTQFVRTQLIKHYDVIYRTLVLRDGEECKMCEARSNLAIDHIVQVINGGTNCLDNLQLLCKSCNSSARMKVRDNRMCVICGHKAFIDYCHKWYCQTHSREIIDLLNTSSIARKDLFKTLRTKYRV